MEEDVASPRCGECGARTPTAWVQQAAQKAAEALRDVGKIYAKGHLAEARDGFVYFLQAYRGTVLHRRHA